MRTVPCVPLPPDRERSGPSRLRCSAGRSDANPTQQSNNASPEQPSDSRVFVRILKEFCSDTTIHGFRYFTEPKRHWVERLWWIIAVVVSISVCGYVTHNIWAKWNEHPVIVAFDDKLTSIDRIPFPAVTACLNKKFHKLNVNIAKIKAALNNGSRANRSAFAHFSSVELSRLNAILQTCSVPHPIPADLVISSDPSIYYAIEENIKPTLSMADWGEKEKEKKLEFTFTDDGLCYTFNSLNSHEIYADGIASELLTVSNNPNATHWNREDGYEYTSNVDEGDVYPLRSVVSGHGLGLVASIVTVYDDSEKFCSSFAAGLHVSLHAPDDIPRPRNHFIHVPRDHLVSITVTPNVVTTSNGLRSYDPHKRGCHFQSERRLRFFRSYSEHKCELECLTNYTRDECGCVHFAMPRDEHTKVCTIVEMECYRAAKQRFDKQHILKQCDCLPDCYSISFESEMFQVPDNRYLNQISGASLQGATLFGMSFKEDHFISVNRIESSTMSEFFSNFGGLLGLFMGVSVLSIVELIYYFTLRLFIDWKRRNKVQPIESIEQTQNDVDTAQSPGVAQEILVDYLTNTTVHGLRYVTEPKRHCVERVTWAVVVIASFALCGIIIQNIWTNWHENPVIVSFADKISSVDTIPFPAVTICPSMMSTIRKVDVDKLVGKFNRVYQSGHPTAESMSPEEISQLDASVQVDQVIVNFPPNFSIPSNTLIYDAMRNITLEEDLTIQSVNWLSQLNQFKFKMIFTSHGLCYTFNSLNSHEIYSDVVEPELLTIRDNPNAIHWDREAGYQLSVNQSGVFPYRVFGSDVFNALIVRLGYMIEYRSKNFKSNALPSFLFIFHTPDELPPFRRHILVFPSEHDVYISVRPAIVTTSNGLRSYSPHARGCYFQSERQLRFFKKYNQKNCRLECLTDYRTKECGCSSFAMPREKHTRICTMVDLKCMQAAYAKYKAEFYVKKCDCLPDCTSIVYHTEVSQVPYHYYEDAEMMEMKRSYKYPGYLSHGKLHISFKEDHFVSVNRAETSTMSDFFSNCGGLLGLFMGISVLSFVELIYYFTLRLGVNWWRHNTDRINRIKRACAAFIRGKWEKLKERKRIFVAFIRNQWERLGERMRKTLDQINNTIQMRDN